MNLFNRIVVFLVLLALAAGAIAIAVLAWTIPTESIDGLRDSVDWLEEHNKDLDKALLTTGAALIALITLSVIVIEVMPRYGPDVKVTDAHGGEAVLSTASVAQSVEAAIRQVPHVADVKALVRSRRKGVEVSMDLHVDAESNLAEVADAAYSAAEDVLSNRIHVAMVSPPKARLHYRELRLRRADAPAALEAATPSVANAATPEPAGSTPAAGQPDEAAAPEELLPEAPVPPVPETEKKAE